jgi:uncharacterized protein (TIGR04562 family)
MALKHHFPKLILEPVLGGLSAIDVPSMEVHDFDEAYEFIRAYGYDLNDPEDKEEVWGLYRRAITLIQERLLLEGEKIPEVLTDPNQLEDIRHLLVYASTKAHEDNLLQLWSCAILRVMHVCAHVSNDLFQQYGDQIQDQVIKDFYKHITEDKKKMVVLGLESDLEQIHLKRFDVKPFKTTASSVIKLLTKKNVASIHLMDKMGVRFVTNNVYDAFRVVHFLIEEHVISYPNLMPDQSHNTFYPVNLFREVIREVDETVTYEDVNQLLVEKLENNAERAKYLQRRNAYSGRDFKMIKFVHRKLIEISVSDRKKFHFFFPYEIQVMDYETYLANITGSNAHEEYKRRQRETARRRVLGLFDKELLGLED